MILKPDRRRNGIIDKLPALLKESVEQMLLAGSPYREIVEFLGQKGVTLSRQAVCNYARKFLATTKMMRVAENNFRALTEAIENAPELDTAEGIIRVVSNHLLNALTNMSPEDLTQVDPAKLLKEANALIRVTSFKRRVDTQNKDEMEKSATLMQSILFERLHKEHPKLLEQLNDVLQASLNAAERGI